MDNRILAKTDGQQNFGKNRWTIEFWQKQKDNRILAKNRWTTELGPKQMDNQNSGQNILTTEFEPKQMDNRILAKQRSTVIFIGPESLSQFSFPKMK